jgi:hypothetical protein
VRGGEVHNIIRSIADPRPYLVRDIDERVVGIDHSGIENRNDFSVVLASDFLCDGHRNPSRSQADRRGG